LQSTISVKHPSSLLYYFSNFKLKLNSKTWFVVKKTKFIKYLKNKPATKKNSLFFGLILSNLKNTLKKKKKYLEKKKKLQSIFFFFYYFTQKLQNHQNTAYQNNHNLLI
jgi:hypothetical protein